MFRAIDHIKSLKKAGEVIEIDQRLFKIGDYHHLVLKNLMVSLLHDANSMYISIPFLPPLLAFSTWSHARLVFQFLNLETSFERQRGHCQKPGFVGKNQGTRFGAWQLVATFSSSVGQIIQTTFHFYSPWTSGYRGANWVFFYPFFLLRVFFFLLE